MLLLQQSEATAAQRRIPIYLVDATNGYTPETGLSSGFTIEVSKNGAAQAAGGGSITEIGEGQYYYEATAAELNTVGFLAISIRHASCRDFFAVAQVVPWDVYLDFVTNISDIETDTNEIQSKLPTNNIMGSSVLTAKDDEIDAIKTATDQLNFDGNNVLADVMVLNAGVITAGAFTAGAIDANAIAAGAITSSEAPNLDAAITTRSSHTANNVRDAILSDSTPFAGAQIALINTGVDNIEAKLPTGNLVDSTDVENACDSSIESYDLDHLIQVAVGAENPTIDSYMDWILNKDGSQTYDPATDSLEAQKDAGGAADWSTAEREQIRDALGVDGTKTAATGGDLQDILTDTNEIQGKLPTNNIMGSTVLTAKDDEIDAIKAVTDLLPNAGALTDIDTGVNNIEAKLPTNYIMGSAVQTDKDDDIDQIITDIGNLNDLASSDIQTVIENNDLDHLIQVAAGVEKPTVDSYLDQIMNKAGTQDFDPTTDSLEAIRDRGDAEWDTATGFSTHAAADVWTVGTRDITGGTVDTATSVTNDVGITQAGADKVWSTASRSLTDKAGFTISGTITTLDGLENISTTEVNTEIDTALADIRLDELINATAGAVDPTIGSFMDQIMNKDGSQTFSQATDSLEAIVDAGGTADWTTNEKEQIRFRLAMDGTQDDPTTGTGTIEDILADTNEMQGKLPSGTISDITTTQVNTEVDTALSDIRLDELINVTAGAVDPTIGSFMDQIMNKDGSQTFSQATDSLEAIVDAGGAADWTSGEKEQIRDALGIDGTKTAATGGQLQVIDTNVDDIETDTNEIQGKLPAGNLVDATAVNTEVDTALSDIRLDELINVTAGAVDPTIGSFMDQIMNKDGSQTFSQVTDSLEAIVDAGGAADWTSGEKEQIRDALGVDGTKTAASGGDIQSIEGKIDGLNDIAAADVWAVGSRSLTDKAGFTISGTITTLDALDTALDTAHGAGAWATAVGFSTHSEADVWTTGSRELSTPNNYKADVSGLATEANATSNRTIIVTDLDDIKGTGFVKDTDSLVDIRPETDKIQTVDDNVDLILVDTDTTIPGLLATIQADLDTPNQYKADVSGLATTVALNTHDGKLDTVDANVDSIKAITDNMPADTEAELTRILGMLFENAVWEFSFTGDDQTSGGIWLYDSAANATTHNKSTGLIGEYGMTCTFASGKPQVMKITKVS